MINNKIKLIITSLSLILSNQVLAGHNDPSFSGPMTTVESPMYINYCQNEIMATSFLPAAMVNFNMTESVLENTLYIPLMTTLQTMMTQNSQTIINTMNKMKIEFMKIKMEDQEKKMELDNLLKKSTEGAKDILDSFAQKEDNKLFNDASSGLETQYFRQLCINNKIKEKTQGSSARIKSSIKVNLPLEQAIIKQEEMTNAGTVLKTSSDERLEKYCSQSEMMSGLCKEVSDIPNGDLQADIFLFPNGDNTADSGLNATKFTYNEIEEKVAQDFINNVVGLLLITSPTLDELNNPKTQNFVLMYKNLISSINLSRMAFQESIQKRTKVSGIGDKAISYLDYMDFLIQNSTEQSQLDLLNSTNKEGSKIALYNAMALTNKLQLEIFSQNETIKLLDAALLSQKENKAINQRYMESRRVK